MLHQRLDPSLVCNLPPFNQLRRDQIAHALSHATSQIFHAGTPIFHEGDTAERFFMLLDGHIRVARMTADGHQVILLHVPPGQLFGIAKALGRTTYPATATAAEDCVVLCWQTSLWDSFIETLPGFATASYHTTGERMNEMQDTILAMATQHVEQRVAASLLRLVQQGGKKVGDAFEISFPITRQNISEMTGTTLHTVSRLLSAWEREGVIDSRRKHIRVLDPHRLMVLSGA